MAVESHRADLLRLWADALHAKDMTAAEREEFGPWRARAIADEPSAYEDRDFFALVKEFGEPTTTGQSDSAAKLITRACFRVRGRIDPGAVLFMALGPWLLDGVGRVGRWSTEAGASLRRLETLAARLLR